MTLRILAVTVAAATLALGIAPGTALASRPVFTVAGKVTAVASSGQTITVNGQAYSIKSHSPAANEVDGIDPGEYVQLVLNGPSGLRSTQVVAIHATSSR